MIPAHSFVGNESAPHLAFVLHGVLGSGNNFKSFIRKLADERPDYRFVLVDLRYHGSSTTDDANATIDACVDDLFELGHEVGKAPRAVIGHSLGGKVALCYGRRFVQPPVGQAPAPEEAQGILKQVWALDSDPGAQDEQDDHQVKRVVAALLQSRGPFSSRNEAMQSLSTHGLSTGLVQWLATSLERVPSAPAEFRWKLQIDSIAKLLENYFALDVWEFLEKVGTRPTAPPLPRFDLLLAEKSDRWSGSMIERAERLSYSPQVRVHRLPDAGHWVHVDNPEGLQAILAKELL